MTSSDRPYSRRSRDPGRARGSSGVEEEGEVPVAQCVPGEVRPVRAQRRNCRAARRPSACHRGPPERRQRPQQATGRPRRCRRMAHREPRSGRGPTHPTAVHQIKAVARLHSSKAMSSASPRRRSIARTSRSMWTTAAYLLVSWRTEAMLLSATLSLRASPGERAKSRQR